MFRTEEDWLDEFRRRDCYFEHDGNPKRPHPLLASGNHSKGFVNCRPFVADGVLLADAASILLDRVGQLCARAAGVEVVAGPQTGATKLAQCLAAAVPCDWVSPAKTEEGPMLLSRDERLLVANKTVLLCEDVVTTGGSLKRAVEAIVDAGGRPLPYVLALVNRSGERVIEGRLIVSLVSRDLPIWSPEECPLCAQGSEPIRPKDNWPRLVADY